MAKDFFLLSDDSVRAYHASVTDFDPTPLTEFFITHFDLPRLYLPYTLLPPTSYDCFVNSAHHHLTVIELAQPLCEKFVEVRNSD